MIGVPALTRSREPGALLLEAERAERFAKAARLRRLRTYSDWLVPDSQAVFGDEVDCSALFEGAPAMLGSSRSAMSPFGTT